MTGVSSRPPRGDREPGGDPPPVAAGRRLSGLIGVPVECGDRSLGFVCDVAARPTATTWPVVALRVRRRRRVWEVAAATIVAIEDDLIVLAREDAAGHDDRVVWLRSSVLDHRVIDVDGRRIVRVGDVALEHTSAGLAVVAIELGRAPLLRRLGLSRLARHVDCTLVPVTAIHVPRSSREAIELATSADRLSSLSSRDIAGLLARLPLRDAGRVVGHLPLEHAAAAVDAMPVAHAVDVLDHAPDQAGQQVVGRLPASHPVARLRHAIRPPRRLSDRLHRLRVRRP